jgi:hypothetical protein
MHDEFRRAGPRIADALMRHKRPAAQAGPIAQNTSRGFDGMAVMPRKPERLKILERDGIENYAPQTAFEAVLRRNLNGSFPIPDKKREEHFGDPGRSWRF